MPMKNKPPDSMTFFLPRDEAEDLRRLCDALGIYITKGPGANEIGSIRGLNIKLAEAARNDLEGLATALRPFVQAKAPE
jgi:hypothetical protein